MNNNVRASKIIEQLLGENDPGAKEGWVQVPQGTASDDALGVGFCQDTTNYIYYQNGRPLLGGSVRDGKVDQVVNSFCRRAWSAGKVVPSGRSPLNQQEMTAVAELKSQVEGSQD